MTLSKFETGDYQTPVDFAKGVCSLLKEKYGINPTNIVEPTMGKGSFLQASKESFPNASLFGIEIDESYINEAKSSGLTGTFFCDNIFTFDFNKLKDSFKNYRDGLLLIGNPPWVTNSSLSSIDSINLPFKDNFKKEKGFDAVTGKGNFDICEYIFLELLSEFKNHKNCFFAFLCKEIVAKNIIRDLHKYDFNLDFADLYSFDSSAVFGVSCDAVLFVTKISQVEKNIVAHKYNINSPFSLISSFGYVDDKFISNIDNYNDEIDGHSQLMWRQGIKHDCSKVMEIVKKGEIYLNGYKEPIDFFDSKNVYPLVKSSGFKKSIINSFDRYVIVTQHYVREDTSYLQQDEKLYSYLVSHRSDFEKRKSIIYKNTPEFSIFGIGEYSFLKYKIGLSGFYKEPKFSFLLSTKPVMVDDTCYFIGSDNKNDAMILYSILDSTKVYNFLKSISFQNSKRPFTKDVLQRLDLLKLINSFTYEEVINKVSLLFNVTIQINDIDDLKKRLLDCEQSRRTI